MTMNDAILNFAEEKLLSGWWPRPLVKRALKWMREYSHGPQSHGWFDSHEPWMQYHHIVDDQGGIQDRPIVWMGTTLALWGEGYKADAPWWNVIDAILEFLLNNVDAIIKLLQDLGILTDNQYEVINDQSPDFARVNGLS